jgi:hypothetical protein
MTGARRTLGVCGTTVLAAALALAGAGCAATSASTTSASTAPTAPASSATPRASTPAAASVSPADAGTASAAAPSAAASSPAAAGASAPTASTAATSACSAFAAGHAFLHLTSATDNTDGTLTVTGVAATMVCGGPDDFHYDFGTATVTGHVLASATIQVLSSTLQPAPITLAKFPGYLASDMNVRVFAYTGPRTAVTAMTEQFHP